jgi:proline dehydrogenase
LIKAILIYLSQASWARKIITGWAFSRRAASRFISGDTLGEAITTTNALNKDGLYVTLDHLGEHVRDSNSARESAEAYFPLLDRIDQSGSRAGISLKLTQLGLLLDSDLCLKHLSRILDHAREKNNFVRIDIEDSPVIDRTMRIYSDLREMGFDNVGMAIQSYLYRSEEDTIALLDAGCRIRLVKGAYKEPPELAYPRKADVDRNFDYLAKIMIDHALAAGAVPVSENGKFPPVVAIATHDEARIKFAKEYASKIGLPNSALEFQMLFGIRTSLQTELALEGYPVRVYVPYGLEWYPYYVRRLAERPANLWFFLSNLFRSS